MQKELEIELEFEMRYQFDSLRVVYCTEGIHKNRIQDIIKFARNNDILVGIGSGYRDWETDRKSVV